MTCPMLTTHPLLHPPLYLDHPPPPLVSPSTAPHPQHRSPNHPPTVQSNKKYFTESRPSFRPFKTPSSSHRAPVSVTFLEVAKKGSPSSYIFDSALANTRPESSLHAPKNARKSVKVQVMTPILLWAVLLEHPSYNFEPFVSLDESPLKHVD